MVRLEEKANDEINSDPEVGAIRLALGWESRKAEVARKCG